jgi:A/G-specific adenine glycosylase
MPPDEGALSKSRANVLAWFAERREAYPWRTSRDLYRVLVSEIMLQQTQAARVVPAFRSFLRRFPTVVDLAAATRGDVLRAWSGLGYNRRAVALSEAARIIVRDHGGVVPRRPEELVRLPGVGPYTAAAVASIAHGEPVAAVDTNVRRVVARALLGRDPDRVSRSHVEWTAAAWLSRADPGSWNQALMDLGREVCRPAPRCEACPLSDHCWFRPRARTATRPARRQPPFEGSSRQLRGRLVAQLRDRNESSLRALSEAAGEAIERVAGAVAALAAEGLVEAGPAALQGRPRGRVRLPR